MNRYFIYLSYNGTAYCGWQIQPNGISVQEVLTNSLRTVFRNQEINIVGAGRTDAGVHAKEMVAHFDLPNPINDTITLCKKLNSFLPKDIALEKIVAVRSDAHARFDAISRQYEYHIVMYKNVFKNGFVTRTDTPLDFEKMNEAASILKDYTDFSCFSKMHTDVKTNNCVIKSAKWAQKYDEWIFTIKADRFLRNMVRAIVGTLFDVGKGKLSLEGFRKVIESRNRCNAGNSAPASGLYLVKVEYPDSVFL